MHTSNNMHDCERLFVLDFMKLDSLVAKMQNDKQNQLQYLLENFNYNSG